MTGAEFLRTKLTRRLLLLVALAGGLALLWMRGPTPYLSGFGSAGTQDFIQYWSAARLLLWGGDPYDPAALLAMEQAVGWPESEPVRMWNPPWTLALVLPLAFLPFRLAAVVWLLLQLGLILGGGLLLWRYFAPGDGRYWIGLVLAAGFVPGLFALRMGQISPWLLAGVVLFLCADRAQRDALAGGALALLMIKPHVTYLFWLAALWWAWRRRRWRVVTGWLAVLVAASGLVLLVAPDVFGNYLGATAGAPLYWATPTLGGWARLVFGPERHWLQFLPSVAGGLALLVWLLCQRGPWHWEIVTPPLLLGSTLTATYGWSYDQVVLLPVLVALVSRLRLASATHRAAVLGAWTMCQVTLLVQNRCQMNEVFFIWHPWALAGLYWRGACCHRGYGGDNPSPGGER